jgi:NADPH-dependent glutamate synthase beta subunit-like oxidoreductase
MGAGGKTMKVRISRIPKDPYLGYDAENVARMAAACLHCPHPAPCTLACPREADIPRVIRLAGQAACEGLSLTRWFWDRERVETTRITDAITGAYN